MCLVNIRIDESILNVSSLYRPIGMKELVWGFSLTVITLKKGLKGRLPFEMLLTANCCGSFSFSPLRSLKKLLFLTLLRVCQG